MATEPEVKNLLVYATAARDTAFPVQVVDNPIAVEERLRALLAHLRAMVSKAIRQGDATALATAQL